MLCIFLSSVKYRQMIQNYDISEVFATVQLTVPFLLDVFLNMHTNCVLNPLLFRGPASRITAMTRQYL
jgi:hypothetical protein